MECVFGDMIWQVPRSKYHLSDMIPCPIQMPRLNGDEDVAGDAAAEVVGAEAAPVLREGPWRNGARSTTRSPKCADS